MSKQKESEKKTQVREVSCSVLERNLPLSHSPYSFIRKKVYALFQLLSLTFVKSGILAGLKIR